VVIASLAAVLPVAAAETMHWRKAVKETGVKVHAE
jgi:hypothetical protein